MSNTGVIELTQSEARELAENISRWGGAFASGMSEAAEAKGKPKGQVRAGMVADAKEWPWSSYGAMVGSADAPPWLATESLLGQFAPTLFRARALYVDHVRAGVGLPTVWEGLEQQMFLGDEAFLKRMGELVDKNLQLAQATDGELAASEFAKVHRLEQAKPLAYFEQIHRQDRDAAMAAAFTSGHYTLGKIAAHFGVHGSTVSRAVAKMGR